MRTHQDRRCVPLAGDPQETWEYIGNANIASVMALTQLDTHHPTS